ncbi:HypC/HybG/HupF family hydrogenase formation chaperone [Candidatus Falkowbacteria bacterium]|nr:HypC/HybG/HupF family hydrogenase formation chaperone [Candidatus Falkowbacteria bacterium]
MCLSIPYQIKKISGQKATVNSYKKKNRIIDLNILPKVKVGDWVLVLNNFAVNKISASEAKQIINLYKYE